MRTVHLTGTAGYLPERWMTSAEIGEVSGIPEDILVERFGLEGKHIAAIDEHVSDMSVAAARKLLDEQEVDPLDIDAVVYFGSTYTDYQVWHVAPYIADSIGASNAFALELAYTSCGSPVAVKVVRDLIRAEPDVSKVLAVAASRESYLLDYQNDRSRFMFNFGDGSVAALFEGDSGGPEVLGTAMITDGSFSLDVKVPAGGSVEPASLDTIANRRHYLDVPDPLSMKERLDPVSLENFVSAAETAARNSGVALDDIDLLCGIHMKRSMHNEICDALGIGRDDAVYLDDTGHMSGVDPLFGLDRAARDGRIGSGETALLLAAGTGYTWAAACIRW